MSPGGKRAVLAGGVLAMVVIVVVAAMTLFHGRPGPAAPKPAAVVGPVAADPASAARQYLQAFAIGDVRTAGALTDDPRAASAALGDAWQALRPTEIRTTLGKVGPVTGNTAAAVYTETWTLGAGHPWSYGGTFDLVRAGRSWRLHWTPAVLQPTLRTGQRLALVTSAPDQPAVVDRNGRPLVLTGAGGERAADPKAFPLVRSALSSQAPRTPGVFAVERVDAAGHRLATLFGTTGGVRPRRSTLSTAVQSAAQSAVDGYPGPAVIVALRSDGGLLAVAGNARNGGASPFSGLYAPGSTFKIVTATAAIEAGVATPDTHLDCPLTMRIGTRTISNEGFHLGSTTMRLAFAKSCNTTFGQLAHQLPPDALARAADEYGLNADFDIPGQPTQTGDVRPAANSDEQVEDGIGQGRVQVSPFGEALMAATVAAGHPVTPRLWLDAATTVDTGYTAPSSSVVASVRSMMRDVVTEGTATGLAGSGQVHGKTGTAQFGTGEQANGWFVGYRGDIAFVVFLQGANDSRPAVALAARFLGELG